MSALLIVPVVIVYMIGGLATATNIIGDEQPVRLRDCVFHATAMLFLVLVWPLLWGLVLGLALTQRGWS